MSTYAAYVEWPAAARKPLHRRARVRSNFKDLERIEELCLSAQDIQSTRDCAKNTQQFDARQRHGELKEFVNNSTLECLIFEVGWRLVAILIDML